MHIQSITQVLKGSSSIGEVKLEELQLQYLEITSNLTKVQDKLTQDEAIIQSETVYNIFKLIDAAPVLQTLTILSSILSKVTFSDSEVLDPRLSDLTLRTVSEITESEEFYFISADISQRIQILRRALR